MTIEAEHGYERKDLEERIAALELGQKNLREYLLARGLAGIESKNFFIPMGKLKREELIFDISSGDILQGGRLAGHLPRLQKRFFGVLVGNSNITVERGHLLSLVWDEDISYLSKYDCDDHRTASLVRRIRKRLGNIDNKLPARLETVTGVGFRWMVKE